MCPPDADTVADWQRDTMGGEVAESEPSTLTLLAGDEVRKLVELLQPAAEGKSDAEALGAAGSVPKIVNAGDSDASMGDGEKAGDRDAPMAEEDGVGEPERLRVRETVAERLRVGEPLRDGLLVQERVTLKDCVSERAALPLYDSEGLAVKVCMRAKGGRARNRRQQRNIKERCQNAV